MLDHVNPELLRRRVEDLDEPNLMRDIFPYSEVPRIDFDHKLLPIDPAEEFFITDTTFRDGQQARPPYTVRQIAVDLRPASPPFRAQTESFASRSFSSTPIRTGRPWMLAWPKDTSIRI